MVLSKRLAITVILFLSCRCYAQTADEIFNQKKTLMEYLTQQVAALQAYIGYAQKGNSIAKSGLQLIGDIKKGDLKLHANYFNSLKKVKPTVEEYFKVADIISCNVQMIKVYKAAYKNIRESGQFTDKEISYIYSVFTRVIDDAARLMENLALIITPGGYEMKDDERLRRIDALCSAMQDKRSFVQHFSNENYVLSILRKKEKQEAEVSKLLNNVK